MPYLRTQRTAAGGSLVLVLRFIVTSILNYGFGVALAWLLPRSQFGTVSVLQNVLLLAGAVLAAGMPWVLARVMAQAESADLHVADSTFRAALIGNIGLGMGLAVIFVTVQLTPLRVIPDTSWLLAVAVALTIILLSFNTVLVGALQGCRRFDALGLLYTSEVATKALLGLAIVGLLGLGTAGVALGFLAGAVVGACTGWWGLRDRFPRRGPAASGAMFAHAVPMGVGTTGLALLITLDILMLSTLGRGYGISSADVAIYSAAVILARISYFLADALGDAVFPFIAAGRTKAESHAWFVAAFRWVLLGLVPLQLVLLVVPGAVLGLLLPPAYAEAAGLIRIIAVGTLGLLTADMLLKALYACGRPGPVARNIVIAVAVEFAALFVLVPRLGVTGAAIAFAAGSWVSAILLAVAYLRYHRPAWPPARDIARYAVAIGLLLLTLTVASAVPMPIDLMVVSAGLCGYAAVAVRLRLIRGTEVARARAMVSGLAAAVRRVR